MNTAITSDKIVFVVDDDPKVCEALQWLLESVGLKSKIFLSATAFLKNYNPEQQGCVIIDVRMPGMSGLELLDQLKLQKKHLPVIIITGHGDIPMAVRAMKAGAMDFILKPFNDQHLLDQIQKALNHKTAYIDSENNEKVAKLFATLSVRESEVMFLVISGKLNKQIAHELGLALSTVELYRSRVMLKMKAKTIVDLIRTCLVLENQGQILNPHA